MRARLLPLLAVVLLACSIVPVDFGRELLPSAHSTYRTAEFAFRQLIEIHVNRPGSKALAAGALAGIAADAQKKGFVLTSVPSTDLGLTGNPDSDFAKLAVRFDQIHQALPAYDATLMERAAVDGMAKSLNECHTYYVDPENAKTFNTGPAEYQGIGAVISPGKPNELPEIAYVFPGSPAERAGVRAGDRIKLVDGVDVGGFAPEEIANRIRGPEGTTVNLLLSRAGEDVPVAIVRARITPPRVQSRTFENGSIGYVSVAALNGDVTRQTSDELKRLISAGAGGAILDLRNDSGGDFSAAIDIGSFFIRSGVLVYQVGRDGQRHPVRTNDRWFLNLSKPLVVLVNERSASGAEIIAAGVRANGVGEVIGTQTAGCVGISQPREMPDGGLLLITLARMQDAKTGEELNGEGRGVVPDQVVKLDPQVSGDTQLDAAVAFLRGKLGSS